jgi:hypothetical protein
MPATGDGYSNNPENDEFGGGGHNNHNSDDAPSVRVHVRTGEDTLIYNRDVRGGRSNAAGGATKNPSAAATGLPQQQPMNTAASSPATPTQGLDATALLMALASNPALAAQLSLAFGSAAGNAPPAAVQRSGTLSPVGGGGGGGGGGMGSRRNSGEGLLPQRPGALATGAAGGPNGGFVGAILANSLAGGSGGH